MQKRQRRSRDFFDIHYDQETYSPKKIAEAWRSSPTVAGKSDCGRTKTRGNEFWIMSWLNVLVCFPASTMTSFS